MTSDQNLSVRRATPADADAVAAKNAVVQQLHHDAAPWMFRAPDAVASRAYFAQLLEREEAIFLLAEVDGHACGYLYAEPFHREPDALMHELRGLYIHHLAVDEEHRGRGVARQLITHAEGLAVEAGYELVRLDTGAFNTVAQKTFAALGYEAYNIRLEKALGSGSA